MTLLEFKAWFDGFAENIGALPTESQWQRVVERVAEISIVSSEKSTPIYPSLGVISCNQAGESDPGEAAGKADVAIGYRCPTCLRVVKPEPKTNAERQRAYRARKRGETA